VRAPLLCVAIVSLTCASGRVVANPWSTQPLIGIVGQFATNPALAPDGHSETDAALVLNLPVNYDVDSFHFVATPSVRYGDATGYSSVTSNYFHFDTSAQLANDLGSTTFTGSIYRDSSLLYAGEIENGVGVRRDMSSADINWQRSLTELDQLQLDMNTTRTLFAQSDVQSPLINLIDYRYTSFSPAMLFALSERNTFRVIGGAGRYQAIDGLTDSDSLSLQLGFDRQLSELWTLKTSAGYSKSTDREKYYFFGFYFGTIESTQKSTVYSANLVRQGEALTLNLGASRALAPTGFSYLSRQQSVNFGANYAYSERWTFNSSITWQTNVNPLNNGSNIDVKYFNGTFSATWHWTEQWLLTLQATKVLDRYGEPLVTGTSTGISIQISRQFYRADL
jgi:hypothetical protein